MDQARRNWSGWSGFGWTINLLSMKCTVLHEWTYIEDVYRFLWLILWCQGGYKYKANESILSATHAFNFIINQAPLIYSITFTCVPGDSLLHYFTNMCLLLQTVGITFVTSPVIMIPTKNAIAVKKVVAKTWKGCDEKDVKSKGGGQGLCRNAVDHIKNFDNDDPGHITFFCLNVLWLEKNVLQPVSSLSKFLMWSTTFLHRLGHRPLLNLFHHAFSQLFYS